MTSRLNVGVSQYLATMLVRESLTVDFWYWDIVNATQYTSFLAMFTDVSQVSRELSGRVITASTNTQQILLGIGAHIYARTHAAIIQNLIVGIGKG